MNNEEKINKLEERIINLEAEVEDLRIELEYTELHSSKDADLYSIIREIQEEVAKVANQPVGMMFTNLA
jgi:archaellum component FlaC